MRALRRIAIGLGGLAVLVALAVVVRLQCVPSARSLRWDLPDVAVPIPSDAAAIARGRHLSESVAVCTICHGDDLGGKLAFDEPVFGRGYTPNLTRGRGGIAGTYTDADWVRAIRHGVARDGRGLLFMPVDHYRHLSDEDLGAMIAYYRSLPPVDNERTALELSVVARLMIDLGISGPVVRAAVMDHDAARPARPQDEGAYLIDVGGCSFCHGETLTGGQGLEPGAPPGPDLTRSGRLAGWSLAEFTAVLRTGTTPDGHAIDPRFMPWRGYARMTDAEIAAIWDHLQRLPRE